MFLLIANSSIHQISGTVKPNFLFVKNRDYHIHTNYHWLPSITIEHRWLPLLTLCNCVFRRTKLKDWEWLLHSVLPATSQESQQIRSLCQSFATSTERCHSGTTQLLLPTLTSIWIRQTPGNLTPIFMLCLIFFKVLHLGIFQIWKYD